MRLKLRCSGDGVTIVLVPMKRSSVLLVLSLRRLWINPFFFIYYYYFFIVEMQVSRWARGGFWVQSAVLV